ncbi:MAG: ExbD/TolR family protein [Planctomycetota bacterium]|jgi:biopolymer transport protein ExbD
MLSLRRPQHEARVEIMPLIDVIFLLLTFFIYAMVLMVRAELLPVKMQAFESGEPATVRPAVAITIDAAGGLYLNREPLALDDVLARLLVEKANDPYTVVYVAAEEVTVVYVAAEEVGSLDRLPVFLSLYDRLAQAGLDIRLVGRPGEE